jgi:hypothetical protein
MLDFDKPEENGIYYITDCYGAGSSVLYKNSQFKFLYSESHTLSLSDMNKAIRDGMIIDARFVANINHFLEE